MCLRAARCLGSSTSRTARYLSRTARGRASQRSRGSLCDRESGLARLVYDPLSRPGWQYGCGFRRICLLCSFELKQASVVARSSSPQSGSEQAGHLSAQGKEGRDQGGNKSVCACRRGGAEVDLVEDSQGCSVYQSFARPCRHPLVHTSDVRRPGAHSVLPPNQLPHRRQCGVHLPSPLC